MLSLKVHEVNFTDEFDRINTAFCVCTNVMLDILSLVGESRMRTVREESHMRSMNLN
jgi:hypothetical protein